MKTAQLAHELMASPTKGFFVFRAAARRATYRDLEYRLAAPGLRRA